MLPLRLRNIPLHEATRRSLCQLIFVLLAALPVLLTVAVCIAQYIPQYQSARLRYFEREIARATGLQVTIGRVEPREPNKRLLHQVQFHDPETGQAIGQIQTLYVIQNSAGYALHCTQAQIDADLLPTTYRLLHDNVLCRPLNGNERILAWLDGLTVVSSTEAAVKFHQLRADIKRFTHQPAGQDRASATERSTVCELSFDLDEKASGQDGKLTLTRHHDRPEPTSNITLNSGAQSIPLAWAATFAPSIPTSPSSGQFTGQYELTLGPNHWLLRGRGRLSELDVSTWLERPVLTGTASLSLEQLSLSHQMLESVTGELEVREGRIHDLLLAAAFNIGIKPTTQQLSSEARWYDELALRFAIDAQGLHLKALRKDRAIVTDKVGTIAFQYADENYPVPINNLLIALTLATHPQSMTSLAFSPAASRLNQWLPRPLAQPPVDTSVHHAAN